MTKNLRVWQKLALLGLIFLVPFAWVTWKWISTAKAQDLAVMRAELSGVNRLDPARRLLRALEDFRDVHHAWLAGETNLTKAAESRRNDLDEAFKLFASAAEAARTDVPIKGGARLFADWSTHLRAPELPPLPELFEQRTRLTLAATDLLDEIAGESGLKRDNHPARRHLVEAMRLSLPRLFEAITELRGRAAGLAAGAAAAPDDFGRLALLVRTVENRFREAVAVLGKAAEADARLRRLADSLEAVEGLTTRESLAAARRMAAAGKADVTAPELLAVFKPNLDQLNASVAEVGAALRASLEDEVTRLRGESIQLVLWVGLWLMLIFTMCVIIMRDITRPLSDVAAIADRIADGNLAVHIPSDSRRDEMGGLIRAFNRMSQSLSALVGQVQKSGASVNTSITHIAATGREQQSTADAIAQTTSDLGTTARDISATSHELLDTMNSVAAVAEGTASLAGSGREGLARMEAMVRQITGASSFISAKLRALNEKAADINQVVTTITKIADRTNLLSLNAAIEAEKAGEYGRGFSVVATEIRRLADQTAVATYDIEQTVKEMQSAVTAGVLSMDQSAEEVRRGAEEVQRVSAQLGQIIQQVQTLLPRFEEVNDKMRSQAAGGEQISERLAELSRSVQLTAQSLQQSNLAIDQLRATAAGLREGVARFKLPS